MEHRHKHPTAGGALVDEGEASPADGGADPLRIDGAPRRGLWANYRNARLWGKTVRSSLSYARQARSQARSRPES